MVRFNRYLLKVYYKDFCKFSDGPPGHGGLREVPRPRELRGSSTFNVDVFLTRTFFAKQAKDGLGYCRMRRCLQQQSARLLAPLGAMAVICNLLFIMLLKTIYWLRRSIPIEATKIHPKKLQVYQSMDRSRSKDFKEFSPVLISLRMLFI